MDTFFQKLRDIQKKERTTGTLSEIEDSFYNDASNYLQELLKRVNNNPLSLEAYQLRDAQRITTEICERREFKIVSTAATNVQMSHDIFKGHRKDSELYDVIPYNTTPEEEEFYRKIVEMLVDHRENLMEKIILNKKPNETKIGFKPKKKVKKRDSQVIEDSATEDIQSIETEKIGESGFKKQGRPMLDENQIAMMFGKAPDDVLVDENNNPVKPIKKDITTPFKGPKPPEEDTITLQNNPSDGEKNQKNVKKDVTQVDTDSTQVVTKEDTVSEVGDAKVSDEELVEFKHDIPTDILDENEKTYGPFSVDDIVLLPKSIVEILGANDVINIIH